MDKQHYLAGREVVYVLQSQKFIAYFNGGWVRDFLMCHPSNDIDIVTNAPLSVIQKLFAKTIPVGIHFGILIVVYKRHQFEIATFRKEYDYQDGRRPSYVTTATPKEDAKRRDFTINGMFYDPINNLLYDYVKGQRDIQKKIIRAIGNASLRFREDRLRMIRAVRYAVRFDFTIEAKTVRAIIEQSGDLFPSVSIERVWDELQKMSSDKNFHKALLLLYKLGLLTTIFPDLRNSTLQMVQTNLQPMPKYPKKTPLIIKLLELFPKYSIEQKLALCTYLKTSKHHKALVLFWHKFQRILTKIPVEKTDWCALVEFYAHPQSDVFLQIMKKKLPTADQKVFDKQHSELQKALIDPIQRREKQVFLLTGAALMKQGVPPGPHVKALLEEGESLSVMHKLHTATAVFKKLQQSEVWKNYLKQYNSTET